MILPRKCSWKIRPLKIILTILFSCFVSWRVHHVHSISLITLNLAVRQAQLLTQTKTPTATLTVNLCLCEPHPWYDNTLPCTGFYFVFDFFGFVSACLFAGLFIYLRFEFVGTWSQFCRLQTLNSSNLRMAEVTTDPWPLTRQLRRPKIKTGRVQQLVAAPMLERSAALQSPACDRC